jgi:hypothetical protein
MVWVACPLDQIFLAASMCAVIKDLFDNVLWGIIDGDRWRRWSWERSIWEGGRVLVWAKQRDVEDGMYFEGFWKLQLVSDRGDLLCDGVRT